MTDEPDLQVNSSFSYMQNEAKKTMSVFTNAITEAKEEAEAYSTAILKLLGDRDPLQVLENLTSALQHHVDALTDQELRQPEAPEKWSILEVMHHLADSELVWAYRLRLVVAQDRAAITGYDQDAWAKELQYTEANPAEILTFLTVLRHSNLRLLRSLTENQLVRIGVHSERGEESIAHMIRLYAGHDLVHLNQIERIRNSL